MSQADAPKVHVETLTQWRAWLVEHHADETGCWVVWWRTETGRPAPDYDSLICEALTWGWIDATAKRLDEERTMLWFSPRRRGSVWSRPNKQRLERLYAAGAVRPEGHAVVERAQADGSWTLLDDVEDLVVPDDLAAALATHGARATWEAWSPSARKEALTWLVTAKRAATREARVSQVAQQTAAGRRPRG